MTYSLEQMGDNNSLMIFPSNKEIIIEYDLGDKINSKRKRMVFGFSLS